MALSPLARIATDLYALAPEEFTAARDAAARQARAGGDRELAEQVKALRRPPVAAWLANRLVRERTGEIDDLLALGAQLREAQDALDGAALRTMTRRRQEVVRGLSRTAQDLADKPPADAAVRELEATLDAALADEAAGLAVRSGRLMRALSSTGLEEVDLSGAVAAPDDLPSVQAPRVRATARLPKPTARAGTRTTSRTPADQEPTQKREPTQKQKAARKQKPSTPRPDTRATQLADAEASLAAAAAELEAADARLARARETVAAIDAEMADLQAKLDAAGDRRVAAEHERRSADAGRKAAARARDAAQRAVATARRRSG